VAPLQEPTRASIALLTFNGERYLPEVLAAITRQTALPREIIAIDSGSTDATLAILTDSAVPVTRIRPHEFGHATTRNLAARMASGSHVVFLTQDATPADGSWLEHLLAPFEAFPRVAGVYSRHIPRPRSDLLESIDLRGAFEGVRQARTLPTDAAEYRAHILDHIRFSNSSAAYPRALLLEYPFNESIPMGEDQEWAKRMLERRWTIVYEPDSAVLHSHSHSLRQKWRRHDQMGEAFSRFLAAHLGKRGFPWLVIAFNVVSDLAALAVYPAPRLSRLLWMARSPIHRAVTHYAYYRGWNRSIRKDGAGG
jgi:rhamnosyltransferase